MSTHDNTTPSDRGDKATAPREFDESAVDSSQNEPSTTVREYGKASGSPAIEDETIEVPYVRDGELVWVEREINNLTDMENFWPYETIGLNGNLRTLANVLISINYALDISINELYEQRFLSEATGTELERMGARVAAQRRSGEGDPMFRTRVQTRYQQRASTATYEDIAGLLNTLLGVTDATISCADVEGPKTVRIVLPSAAVSESELTTEQIESEISKALSPETSLSLGTDETFVFSSSDSSDRGAGWGEGYWA